LLGKGVLGFSSSRCDPAPRDEDNLTIFSSEVPRQVQSEEARSTSDHDTPTNFLRSDRVLHFAHLPIDWRRQLAEQFD